MSKIRHYTLGLIGPAMASLLLAVGCTGDLLQEEAPGQSFSVQDPHSFARPQEVAVEHLHLDVALDFEKKQISGKASLQVENRTQAEELYLDSNHLSIERVTLGEDETETSFRLGRQVEFLGQPLIVDIQPATELVHIYYSTAPDAAALQWLAPEQTAGGRHPFLFTQSQAILARTWIPCQDTPGVRMTYSAAVRVPPDLMAIMSAENGTSKNPDGLYQFEMPQPIPSYLLALAVGDIEFRPLGERSGVYAEPLVVEKAAWEFADTEKMMAAAEELYGPYRWERYDIIVLPPSFPFGGMENPRLTFATPTILAGDRSLVSLIAHELAHSWSGNLVTNANWDDFWLNEGFTTYFEHRIMEAVYGTEYEQMLAVLSLRSLRKTVEDLGYDHPDTRLHLDLAGRDPDQAITPIAYEKGHFFLRMLESHFGRERWDGFLREYFDEFAFEAMSSARFLAYLEEKLFEGEEAVKEQLQIESWIYQPGLPDNHPRVQSAALEQVDEQLNAFLAGTSAAELHTENWTTQHWLHLLNNLPASLTREQMAELDEAFRFTESGNSEILYEWLLHAIAHEYEPSYPALEGFLTRQGRRKFLQPLYARMAETPGGLLMARRIYSMARPTYHPLSQGTIDEILKWDGA
ncbi:MAG: M1 family metallopeptidase [Acidobacteriota bacterium]